MLNINIPLIYCKVDWSYLTHGGSDGFKDCIIFAAASIPGHALLFHAQLDNGAVYYRLPIDKFSWKALSTPLALNQLNAWNCASADISCITFDWLYNQSVTYVRPNISGRYVTTLDWLGRGTTAEIPQEHKCAHIIKLDNGQFACLPNNYLLWNEPSNVNLNDDSHKLLRTNRDYPSVE